MGSSVIAALVVEQRVHWPLSEITRSTDLAVWQGSKHRQRQLTATPDMRLNGTKMGRLPTGAFTTLDRQLLSDPDVRVPTRERLKVVACRRQLRKATTAAPVSTGRYKPGSGDLRSD
jgi:hypothetical protein